MISKSFVVRIVTGEDVGDGRLHGVVEETGTMKRLAFTEDGELLRFLHERSRAPVRPGFDKERPPV